MANPRCQEKTLVLFTLTWQLTCVSPKDPRGNTRCNLSQPKVVVLFTFTSVAIRVSQWSQRPTRGAPKMQLKDVVLFTLTKGDKCGPEKDLLRGT